MATTDPTKLPGPPVEPQDAQGAQIPLSSFDIPEFPPSARGLRALTLTSNIKVNEYQPLLARPSNVPALPPGIESLTLELFTLGYPPGFLGALAERLPSLKSVVVYSQMLNGTTVDSQKDAVGFFKKTRDLRALHLLDVYAKPGFFQSASQWLKYNTSAVEGEARRGLMFLEVNYTFRSEDDGMMSLVHAAAEELSSLIGPGLISLSFNLSPPESTDGSSEPASNEGIMSLDNAKSTRLVDALTSSDAHPRGLRALNTTLFTLSLEQLKSIVTVQKNVMVLNVTVIASPGEKWKSDVLALLEGCKSLEQVEIVINPGPEMLRAFLQSPASEVLSRTLPSNEEIAALSSKIDKLSAFKMNILRSSHFGRVDWTKKK